VQGGTAADDFMVVQKRQPKPTRCRKSIHAREVVGARGRGRHSGAAVASNIEFVAFLRLFLKIDGSDPSILVHS